MEKDISLQLKPIKLLGLDVDGVLTDGGIYITDSGEEIKRFDVKDGLGLQLLMRSGIEVAIISASRSPAIRHRAERLGIRHVLLGVEDKLTALKTLCQQLELQLENVAYVGDDATDTPVLLTVGCPLTVADAIQPNKNCAIYITQRPGGHGAVRELCDLFLTTLAV